MKHYPVKWFLNALKYSKGKTCHLCVCGYTKRIWYMAQDIDNPIKPFIINSIDISAGECLDCMWCLDLECEYNKTTPESYAKSYHLNLEDTKDLIDGWNRFIENVKGINTLLEEDYNEDELGIKGFTKTSIMLSPGPLVEFIKAGGGP